MSSVDGENESNHTRTPTVGYDAHDKILYVTYYIGRILVLFISYFLCIVGILYGIGSVVKLDATNLYCPIYSEQEVRQHNFENNLPYGDDYAGCWYINQQTLNFRSIYDLNLDIFTATIDTSNCLKLIQSVLYFTVALILLISTVYQTYFVIYDTLYAVLSMINGVNINSRIHEALILLKNNNDQSTNSQTKIKQAGKDDHDQSEDQNNCKLCIRKLNLHYYFCIVCQCYKQCMKRCLKFYFKYIMPSYYVDSKLRMLSLIFREWFEIGVQFHALLLYGGINIFDTSENVLSQEPHVIATFAIIVATNCIIGMTRFELQFLSYL